MDLKNRRELIHLTKKLNFKVGVEVGVSWGLFSKFILENSDMILYSVDPWEDNAELSHSADAYNSSLKLLKPFGERSIMIKDYSPAVCERFQDSSIDFVYIDGLHSFDAVKADLEGWYDKVKTNGIIAGHDYSEKDWIGVVMAVNGFCYDRNIQLNLTGIGDGINNGIDEFDGNQKSWWFYKK